MLALLLAGISWFLAPAHFVVVPHSVCATHGELAHGEAHDHDHDHDADAEGVPVLTGAADEHSDHCGLDPASKPRALCVGDPTGDAGVPLPTLEPAALSLSEPVPSIPVFRLAPKHSPPGATRMV